ncbi:hemagglutinin repeat-containing protein [Pseudomonas solani]|uniref:hemagglutinin repeat-containing protein n=1 Tax=Pseudomonas solani TaxID=2731552 RepID=UPI003D6A0B3C
MDVRSPLFQNIATLLVGVMFLNPIVSTAADLAVDAAAGGNTSIGSAGNGVPVVNIATPNANGLSHNRFTDYNVGQQGLILNNATDKLQNTQLGGYIIGNTNLNGRAAGLILNEVNGGSPSQLKGYTEVAGQGAHVIVANPHGITCDGCGFINTPKVTLSTGKPVVENGRLDRYDVDGGSIAIEGAGLNAGNVDQFELITRSAQINAELHAKQLAMVTGRNEVDAATLAVTAKADDGSAKPQLAIDSSALGGMYAGAIRLVGTEQGVGVKLAGDMAASGGDIQIDANGKLTLARTAASGDIALKATDVDLTRSAYAGGKASVTSGGTVEVKESLAAAGDLSLNAARIDNQGSLEAGVRADGSANTASVLDIQGGTLTNRGKVLAQGTLTTDLAKLDNQGAQLVAAGSAQVKAQTLENQGGQLIGRQDLKVDGKQLDNSGGTLAANKALTVTVTDEVKNLGDGLILSKSDGLTLTTAVLDNQGGTLQADSGELKATARTRLDNRSGKVLAGDGTLTLTAGELRNQQGRLNAQGGALTATVDSLGNGQGRIQGDSVELTSTTRLDNGQGQIVATQGDLSIKRGEVINDGGQLLAKQAVTVDADSLRNQGGTVGGDSASLTLTGKLANDGGLIEASKTLALDIGSASNAGGKLRALGSTGTSAFAIGGRFDNDGGLVEIGNAGFSLTSASLSNQQGTLRHVGTQGFALSLADAGQAGGSFITNGVLSLDVADWTNSSLLQAQRLDLKVGTFTQTASGKLVSIDDITASGGDWTNDGAIETEGSLQLALTGRYQGNGSLKSLGDLTLSAANAELGQGAQLRSGGKGEFRLGSSLVNAGTISTVGDTLLIVASLDNRGTLGAAQKLRIEAPTLLNQGLVFSGADMALRANSLTNLKGDIYSLGALSAAKDDANGQMALLENRSGTVESAGDMRLDAASLINRKDVFASTISQTSGRITLTGTDNCKGNHCEASYVVDEEFGLKIIQDSARASLIAGGDLTFVGGDFDNRFSTVSAGGDISLDTRNFLNTGAAGGEKRYYDYYIYTKSESQYYGFIANIGRYNDYNDPNSPNYNPAAMPLGAIAIGSVRNSSVSQTSGGGDIANAVVQAAGRVDIKGTQTIENGLLRPGEQIDRGASRVGQTAVSSDAKPVATLNAQLAPDSHQQSVDPLALPSFSLPQGQNGLFQVSNNPSHRYLVETNPAFANLKNFLSSDYLLGRLGFDPDQAQKRLGDGLYEQRLIREAVIARTGQRLIAGLDSDEAMYRYLMDNAIASKSALNLAPGVALTSEQVAALTHDIVWMQEQVVNGEKVLVPVLYLAQANNRLAPTGALIQGRDVSLISGGDLANKGTLRASAGLQASAENIDNRGLIQAGDRLALLATDSIRNAQGGIINGKDVSVAAVKGDITNERSVGYTEHSGRFSWSQASVDSAARIEATNSLDLDAGRDLNNLGGVLKAGGNANLSAGRDLTIGAVAEVDSADARYKKSYATQSQVTQHGSEVQVGGALRAEAGQDLGIVASKVTAGQELALVAGRDVSIESAANESHRASRSKKVQSSNDQIRQQASVVQAGGDISIEAGQDLTLVASQIKGAKDVALDAERDTNLLSAKDEDASFYFKKSKGSFGRKKTEQRESYDSTNIASVVEAGGDLTLNTSKAADGSLNIDGGRNVTVIGSELHAGNDLLVGATGDVAILSGVEEHGSYSKKTKSGFLGMSKSGKSQLKTSATQVASELEAGNDVVIAAGNDIRLRASEASAGNDVELRAGLVKDTGDINLVSANDTAYSLTKEYKKKVGLSTSGGFLSISSAKEAGREAQSSTSVGSQVYADRDATLQAERDINVIGSGINAGRNVSLDAGRDVNVVAAQNSNAERDWEKKKQVGIGISGNDNGINLFIGADRAQEKNRLEQQTAAASQITAGKDLGVNAGRDINQIGSDLAASNDINLKAGHNINIDAARETKVIEHVEVQERQGLGISLNHNFGSTKDAVSNAGKGENSVSQGSSALRGVDAVSQFLAGPTADVKLGNSKQSSSQEITEQTTRASTLEAGNDLNMTAGNDVQVKGSQLGAGRDINVKGRDITLDVAKGETREENQERQSWGGIHGGTSGGFKVGVGGSNGVANEDRSQGSSSATQLDAGRDINLQASNDLSLIGTEAKAERDINLNAGNDLKILSAQNASNSESNRHNGGGEVGLTFGSQGVGVYVSVNMGKGDLEREADRQQEAYLYAGNSLNFNSGKDTTISGATLRGDEVVGRVGGDLHVSSAVDTGEVKGKEFDVSATATFGPGAGFSGSVGYGQTTGKTNWVGEQTSITAKDKLDIRTENHTQIDGALIASDSGNLKLDTNTLGHSDIAGVDKEHGYYLNVGGTYSAGGSSGGTTQDASQVGKGKEGEAGWSVNGWEYEKDRQQIVRATVGDGDVIVRKDSETGADSTAGLNRDISKAYEITRDHEERTDLYVTKSSVEAVSNPKETLRTWKENADNYGRNSVDAFANLGVLRDQALSAAEHDKLVAALAWAPDLLVNAMDGLADRSYGILPGVKNNGGLLTQLPVLVAGDLRPLRVQAMLEVDSEGDLVLDEGGKPKAAGVEVSRFEGFRNGEEKIFTNGIMNSLSEAIVNGLMQSGSGDGDSSFVLAYNPTHGLVGDLIESAFDKNLQGAVRSGTARNLNGLFQEGINSSSESLYIYGHSQGGLLTWVALKGLDFSKGSKPSVQINSIQLSGAPVDAVKFHGVAKEAGFKSDESRVFQINRPNEKTSLGLPKTDAVADLPYILGGNSKYSSDPTALGLGAFFSLASLMGKDSPHSNYSCVNCPPSPGGVNEKIRDIVISPTVIDEGGAIRRLK